MSALSITRQALLTDLRRAGLTAVAVLLAASALSLAFAGSAAATVGTGLPISLNTTDWSGNAGFGATAPTAYFDDYGDVHLWGAAAQGHCGRRGCVLGGPDPNLLGSLPGVAYTPQRNVFTIAHTFNGTYVDVEIVTNGQIRLISPRPPAVTDYSFVSLEGISYRPLNNDSLHPSTQIQLNGNNWSPDTLHNTVTPAVYEDGGGVHLEGAAVQTSTQPSPLGPNVIGTIPQTYWPIDNVFTIAHTFNGTYADLEITGFGGGQAPGQVVLLGARSPAVQDYTFVSLEGISYSLVRGLMRCYRFKRVTGRGTCRALRLPFALRLQPSTRTAPGSSTSRAPSSSPPAALTLSDSSETTRRYIPHGTCSRSRTRSTAPTPTWRSSPTERST